MTALFDFPREYAKLGNWPGTINANQAQVLFMHAMNMQKQDARFVELGFDGGRTTVVINWVAQQINGSIDVVSVADPESSLWFNRAVKLFKMNPNKVKPHVDLASFACDMLVINSSVDESQPMSRFVLINWLAALQPGALIVDFGKHNIKAEKINATPGATVYVKPGPKVMDAIIDKVVSAVSDGGNVRSLVDGKKHRRKSESEAPVVANLTE